MPDDPPPEEKPARVRWRSFFRLAIRFWSGTGAGRAWMLAIAVALLVGVQLALQLGMNLWNRAFFDALEQKRAGDLWHVALLLPALVLATGAAAGAAFLARMMLQVRWREWMTRRLAGWWIEDQRYYRLGIANEEQTAPEYRIAEDVRLALDPLADFAIGILTAFATIAAFVGILWSVGGAIAIPLGGGVLQVPGYLALAAALYALLASGAAYAAGRRLVVAYGAKNESEAQFRAEMTRLRENAESIALIRGDDDERKSVVANYGRVVAAWLALVWRSSVIATVQSVNGTFVPVLPLILAAPKYLSGELSLGAVVQLVAAFVTVQSALNWFIDNFVRIAEWTNSANRVDELAEALEDLDASTISEGSGFIESGESQDDSIRIENLSVAHRNGRMVIADAQVTIAPGEKVLVGGASGTGKSTLIRALAGLWPWGSGRILLPKGARIAFVPQKPYIPLGTLRQALLYPQAGEDVPPETIAGAMRRCGLGYLVKRLDEEARWDQTLSGGERQRVAFARLLLQRPGIIIMDEATSALDEDSQASLMQLMGEDLAAATVISVGHRPGLEDFHDRKLTLERHASGAQVSSRKLQKSLWHLFR